MNSNYNKSADPSELLRRRDLFSAFSFAGLLLTSIYFIINFNSYFSIFVSPTVSIKGFKYTNLTNLDIFMGIFLIIFILTIYIITADATRIKRKYKGIISDSTKQIDRNMPN